jgi:hypothetical protein
VSFALAREQQIPRLAAARVRAWPLVKNRRGLQDVGGCLPAVKAAIDGLVDAGVLRDDSPTYLRELVFTPAVVGDVDGLMLVVEELVEEPPADGPGEEAALGLDAAFPSLTMR